MQLFVVHPETLKTKKLKPKLQYVMGLQLNSELLKPIMTQCPQ